MTTPLLPRLNWCSEGDAPPALLGPPTVDYRRNLGHRGFQAAKALLHWTSMSEAEEHAREEITRSESGALPWCRSSLAKRLTHLRTGPERHWTTSRFERQNRGYRLRTE